MFDVSGDLGKKYRKYGKFVWGPVVLSLIPAAPIFLAFITVDPRIAIIVGAIPVAGSYLFFSGFADYRLRMFLRDTPTSKTRSVALGLVEVKGKAEPYKEVLKSPLSDRDVVCYKYRVQEYRQQGKTEGWEVIDEGRRGVPFYVRDETGRILVDPEGADLSLPRDNFFRVDGGEAPPEPIRRFIEENPDVDSEEHEFNAGGVFSFRYGNDRMYTEWFVEPGNDVYVFGTALNREMDGRERVVINTDRNAPIFLISDSSESKVSSKFFRFSLLKLAGGFLLLLVTTGLLYFILV